MLYTIKVGGKTLTYKSLSQFANAVKALVQATDSAITVQAVAAEKAKK